MKQNLFTFEPVGIDAWDKRGAHPPRGTLVRKCQPPGARGNGTTGHCFIEDAATGHVYGLCLHHSLRPAAERART